MLTALLYIYLTGWLLTGTYQAGKCVGNEHSRMTHTECKIFMGAVSAGWPYYVIKGDE